MKYFKHQFYLLYFVEYDRPKISLNPCPNDISTVPNIAWYSCSAVATTANEAVDSIYDNVINMVATKGPLKINEKIY